MKALQVILVTLVLSLIPFNVTFASEVLRIETIEGPPWGFIDSDGKPTGMMYEISNKIAETAGFKYINRLVPYARIAVDINEGSADFALQFPNETIAKGSIEVAKVVTMPVIIVGPKGSSFKSLKDLHGKLVGVIRTSSYVKEFDQNPNIKKHDVADYKIMAEMVKLKRLDAGIGSSIGFYYSAKLAGIHPNELSKPLIVGNNSFVLHLSKKSADPKKIDSLNKAIKKMTDNGEIKKIIKKYMGDHNPLENSH